MCCGWPNSLLPSSYSPPLPPPPPPPPPHPSSSSLLLPETADGEPRAGSDAASERGGGRPTPGAVLGPGGCHPRGRPGLSRAPARTPHHSNMPPTGPRDAGVSGMSEGTVGGDGVGRGRKRRFGGGGTWKVCFALSMRLHPLYKEGERLASLWVPTICSNGIILMYRRCFFGGIGE